MSVEQPTYGLSNWPLPSPSATPKSSASHQLPLETPRTDSPSHFADAYYTPSLTGQQTPALTPASISTAVFRPLYFKNSPLSPDDPEFHVNISAASKLPLPPVDPSKQLSSSPNPQDAASDFSRVRGDSAPEGPSKMDPFHMQTPPPGDGSRNRHDHNQHPIPGQPFSLNQDALSTPIRHPHVHFQNNAFQTPTFQTPYQNTMPLSADMYHYHNAPASAPPIPHARFLWDQSPQMGGSFENRMMPGNHGQFENNGPNAMMTDMRNWQNQELPHQNLTGSFAQESPVLPTPQQESDFWISDSMDSQPGATSFTTNPSFMPTSAAVDPSLLFSFSSPVQTINPSSVGAPYPPPVFDPSSRQPYEQQTRESTRERELAKKSRQQLKQHNRAVSVIGTSARTSLQRSNTDSGFRRSKTKSFDSRQIPQIADNVPRRAASPLKRLSQASLSSIPEAKSRPSKLRTRLVIDETGTARTETVAKDDENDIPNGRNPGLWPGDESSSEDDPILASQRNSLIFPSDSLRPTKHARMDSDEEDSGGLYKRPLSSASLHSLTSRINATPLGRKFTTDAHRRLSQESFSSLSDQRETGKSSQDTIHADDDDDSGDAQNALKKMVGGRLRREFCDPNATIKPRRAVTNPVRPSIMMDISKFPTPSSPPLSFGRPGSSTNTPTTDRSTRSTDSTRCVCGTVDEHPHSPLIQCESCANFLHVRCVFGRRAEERGVKLPRVYVCAFCTGRTRPPPSTTGSGMFYGDDTTGFGASPLGYKSGPFMG